MNVIVARQPIFDQDMHVYAYELLYRTEEGYNDPAVDGETKTGEVIFNSLICLGLDQIISGKKAFINFTKETISKELPRLFSTKDLVVELLEDIEPDDDFMAHCTDLKNSGYTLALDDFVSDYPFADVIDMVHIIKVDFMLTTEGEREEIIRKYARPNVKFLAEKVETRDEYVRAKAMGFDLFQGYFFSRPVLVTGSDVRVFNTTMALVLKELAEEEPSYDVLEQIIKHDFSITFKLLKLVNSAAFYSRNRITSIKHALTMLGFKEIRKIFSLLMIRDAGQNRPNELIRMSMIRAKMCERIMKKTSMKHRASEGFLLGLFSCVDVILDKPMVEAVVDLPLETDVIEALLGEKNFFHAILEMVMYYEQGEFDLARKLRDEPGVKLSLLQEYYMEALAWVDEIVKNG